ncbi:uncharacterized protein RSE6_12014 [Rhynchosporium secalis]|uniref:Uncharacterized protein n=1 Tax=Rhynchosporium secalis TaxID=38038 RepID=A0A1E1MPA7_RHYSE|nr:uncharacterized protein RSE6_12014 [Rhynchosporium secalis]
MSPKTIPETAPKNSTPLSEARKAINKQKTNAAAKTTTPASHAPLSPLSPTSAPLNPPPPPQKSRTRHRKPKRLLRSRSPSPPSPSTISTYRHGESAGRESESGARFSYTEKEGQRTERARDLLLGGESAVGLERTGNGDWEKGRDGREKVSVVDSYPNIVMAMDRNVISEGEGKESGRRDKGWGEGEVGGGREEERAGDGKEDEGEGNLVVDGKDGGEDDIELKRKRRRTRTRAERREVLRLRWAREFKEVKEETEGREDGTDEVKGNYDGNVETGM